MVIDSRDLNDLTPAFRLDVEKLYDQCSQRGIHMRPFQTLRSPVIQARLWRKSRSTIAVNRKVQWLKDAGAPFLAEILNDVGPQPGKLGSHDTNALPGYSWHQYGEAVDSYWDHPRGSACWRLDVVDENGQNGYRVYGQLADDLEMMSGGISWGWDWPHVQGPQITSPSGRYSSAQVINDIMKERFGHEVF